MHLYATYCSSPALGAAYKSLVIGERILSRAGDPVQFALDAVFYSVPVPF
jgi:hypothetical protein